MLRSFSLSLTEFTNIVKMIQLFLVRPLTELCGFSFSSGGRAMQFLIPSVLGAPLVTHQGTAFAVSSLSTAFGSLLQLFHTTPTQTFFPSYSFMGLCFMLKCFSFYTRGWGSQSLATTLGQLS